jgi:hypothetical protein
VCVAVLILGCGGTDFAKPSGEGDAGLEGTSPPPDGACADTANDPRHCGRCGHDCLGGGCAAGRCLPVVLARDQAAVRYLAQDEKSLYWTSANTTPSVMRIEKDGTGLRTIAENQGSVQGVAAWGDRIYFVRDDVDKIYAVDKAGGVITELYTDGNNPREIVADEGGLYYTGNTGSNGGTVRALAAAALNGPAVDLATGQNNPYGFAVDEASAFWISRNNNVTTIYRVDKRTGGTATSFAPSAGPGGLHVMGTFLYWITSDGFINRADKASLGALERFSLPVRTAGSSAMTSDKDFLYVAAYAEAKILRVPPAGAPVEVLATEQGGAADIVVDDRAVYWVCERNNSVVKLAK